MAGPRYKAGDLSGTITVQRRADQANQAGTVKAGWVTIGSGIPARVAPMKGGEQVRALRIQSISTFEIVLRSDSFTRTITAADRLTNQRSGQTYNIRHIANLDERDQWLTITATTD